MGRRTDNAIRCVFTALKHNAVHQERKLTYLNEHGEVVVALVILAPTKLVDREVESVRSLRSKGLAESALDISLEGGESHAVNGVFHSL